MSINSPTRPALSQTDLVMDYLVGEMRQLLGADACALLLPDEESGDLTSCAASGWRSGNPPPNGAGFPLMSAVAPAWQTPS